MKQKELITQAVKVHFAITSPSLSCDTQLEDSATMAKDFLEYFLNGTVNQGLQKALKTTRGQVKKQLIERYIHLNS